MFTLVVGGAASGKSEYAEQLILRAGALPRYYVATMEPFGAEARARIARHRVLRAQKRFETIECPVGLSRVLLPARGAALLECLSNLAANELYSPAAQAVNRRRWPLLWTAWKACGGSAKHWWSSRARCSAAAAPMREIPVPICVCWPRQTGRLPPGRTLFVRWRAACRAIIKERGPRCDAA